jgi:hypothetical protein
MMVGCCEYGIETLGSIKGGKLIDWLNVLSTFQGLCSVELVRYVNKALHLLHLS